MEEAFLEVAELLTAKSVKDRKVQLHPHRLSPGVNSGVDAEASVVACRPHWRQCEMRKETVLTRALLL